MYQFFEDFRINRKKAIQEHADNLTEAELELLEYESDARAYNFMFYYGRLAKQFPAKHNFYKFVNQIDDQNIRVKTLAINIIYKYEIEYLRKYEAIKSGFVIFRLYRLPAYTR